MTTSLRRVNVSEKERIQNNFDETEHMTTLIKNDELLEMYNDTWDKVSNSIKKRFDSEPVYNKNI